MSLISLCGLRLANWFSYIIIESTAASNLQTAVLNGTTFTSPSIYVSILNPTAAYSWDRNQGIGYDPCTYLLPLKSCPTLCLHFHQDVFVEPQTDILLSLPPESLSSVVTSIEGCSGLCQEGLNALFSTPYQSLSNYNFIVTGQHYDPAALTYPVDASAYFWGKSNTTMTTTRMLIHFQAITPYQAIQVT